VNAELLTEKLKNIRTELYFFGCVLETGKLRGVGAYTKEELAIFRTAALAEIATANEALERAQDLYWKIVRP
jgi:hypothetical protein